MKCEENAATYKRLRSCRSARLSAIKADGANQESDDHDAVSEHLLDANVFGVVAAIVDDVQEW